MKKINISHWYKRIIGLVILFVILYFVNLRELWGVLKNLTFPAFLYLMLISGVLIYISALKWKLFLESFGSKISLYRLYELYLLGYFVNLILPSYLGGDAVRSWRVGKKVGQHEAAASTILERFTGLVAMVSLALIFVWFVSGVTWQIKLAVVLIGLGLAIIFVCAISDKTLKILSRIKQAHSILPHLQKIQDSFHLARCDKSLLAQTFVLSLLYHVITVVNTLACAYAIGWRSAPVLDLFVVLPLILLIGAIPISPQGLGIQEGAFVYFLGSVGATPPQALAIAVILRAKSYVLALLGGGAWLFSSTKISATIPKDFN